MVPGSTRASTSGIAMSSPKKQKVLAPQTARIASSPSVALTKAALATRKTSIGPAATKLATTTSCGRMVLGSTRVSTFGIAMSCQKKQKLLAPQTARVALSPSVVQAKAALAIRKTSIGRAATKLATTTTCGTVVLGSTRESKFGSARYSQRMEPQPSATECTVVFS